MLKGFEDLALEAAVLLKYFTPVMSHCSCPEMEHVTVIEGGDVSALGINFSGADFIEYVCPAHGVSFLAEGKLFYLLPSPLISKGTEPQSFVASPMIGLMTPADPDPTVWILSRAV